MSDVDEFLEHYGVKGMKWGVRNRIIESKPFKATQRHARDSVNTRSAKAGVKVGTGIRKGYFKLKDTVDKHPVETGLVVAGAAFVTGALLKRGTTKYAAIQRVAEQTRLDSERASAIAELTKKIGPMGKN